MVNAMSQSELEQQLGQYLSFLEKTIQAELRLQRDYASKLVRLNSKEREDCYRRAEAKLRELFPEIDFYGSLKDK